MSMTTVELKTEWKYEMFEVFLFMLPHYLRYESIEGGPYMRMANISYNSRSYGRHINSHDITDYCNKVIRKYAGDTEFRALFEDLILDKASENVNELGYSLKLNLAQNPTLIRNTVSCLTHNDHIVNYNEGSFTPKTINTGAAETYTEDYCNNLRQWVFSSKKPHISESTIDETTYTLSPSSEGREEIVEDIDVPNRAFITGLEDRLQATYKMYLNVKQNY